ncbi:SCO family protein [Dyadobacter sandarakinus]|uniref:Protein SCO1/2 n=1 Tax=Dyadobacter sandarakinus TaxID=2747268 RepID=A0ABX7IB33_9BACT|nr:hypothetical protein [Dyadobacter sandarakinus]QRR03149.1 hypothetical protein HWI92_20640 [Dyadobacter sandarakinus]
MVIPAFVFAFLQFFGTNHYNLPYFVPERNEGGQVVMSKGDTVFRKLNVISLNNNLSSFELAGKLTVVHFLPQTCEDSCELVLAQLERIAVLENAIPELNLLTLTYSQENSDRIREKADVAGWHTLRGSEQDITSWLSSNVQDAEMPEKKLVLFDYQGYVRGLYNALDAAEIDRLMAEIKILNYEKRKKQEE